MGEGVPKNEAQAAEWYRRAAEQGDSGAQTMLGFIYSQGGGVSKNLVQAYLWFNLAAASGVEEAAKQRDIVEREMTSDQIAEAQRLSAAFVAKTTASIGGFVPFTEFPAPAENDETAPFFGTLSGSGTGFFVTADGWLVTNAHVTAAGSRIRVKIAEKMLPASVKQVDTANDLALLKLEGQFEALAIGPSGVVGLGIPVFTVGFPNPGLQGFSPKMTRGEISSLAGAMDDLRYFQISVPTQPGNSGGPLADASGNVVGVVTARIGDAAAIESSGAIPQNVNYAIKSTYLIALIENVPEAAKGLKEPSRTKDFSDAVQAVEKASAIVLVFD